MDIHVRRYKTKINKTSVITIGTKIYNKLAGFIKEIDNYNAFKEELKQFLLLLHTFYSVEGFVSC
jgi:hypothetical protein